MSLDALDRATMLEDAGGVQATAAGLTDWGLLETPTVEVFGTPELVDTDRQLTADADGKLGGIATGASIEIPAGSGTSYIVRTFRRSNDGGLVTYLLSANV